MRLEPCPPGTALMELARGEACQLRARRLEQHLLRCAVCEDSFSDIAWTLRRIEGESVALRREVYGGDLLADVRDRLAAERRKPRRAFPHRLVPVAAAAVLAAAAAAVLLSRSASLRDSDLSQAPSRLSYSSLPAASLTLSPNPPHFSRAIALGGEALSHVRSPSQWNLAGE